MTKPKFEIRGSQIWAIGTIGICVEKRDNFRFPICARDEATEIRKCDFHFSFGDGKLVFLNNNSQPESLDCSMYSTLFAKEVVQVLNDVIDKCQSFRFRAHEDPALNVSRMCARGIKNNMSRSRFK